MNLSVFLPWMQMLCTLLAVVIAWRALQNSKGDSTYQRAREAEQQKLDGIAQDARVSTLIAELVGKFDHIAADMAKEAEKFRTHDLDCVRDKTRLAEQMSQNTKNIETLTRTVNNLERRAGYVARDDSVKSARPKSTGIEA